MHFLMTMGLLIPDYEGFLCVRMYYFGCRTVFLNLWLAIDVVEGLHVLTVVASHRSRAQIIPSMSLLLKREEGE